MNSGLDANGLGMALCTETRVYMDLQSGVTPQTTAQISISVAGPGLPPPLFRRVLVHRDYTTIFRLTYSEEGLVY